MTATIHNPFADQVEEKLAEMLLPPRHPCHEILIDGRLIPNLEAHRNGDTVSFLLDRRFGLDVPAHLAYQVAWFVANAMAIGAGYPWLGAESKSMPFAAKCSQITTSTDPKVPV